MYTKSSSCFHKFGREFFQVKSKTKKKDWVHDPLRKKGFRVKTQACAFFKSTIKRTLTYWRSPSLLLCCSRIHYIVNKVVKHTFFSWNALAIYTKIIGQTYPSIILVVNLGHGCYSNLTFHVTFHKRRGERR